MSGSGKQCIARKYHYYSKHLSYALFQDSHSLDSLLHNLQSPVGQALHMFPHTPPLRPRLSQSLYLSLLQSFLARLFCFSIEPAAPRNAKGVTRGNFKYLENQIPD